MVTYKVLLTTSENQYWSMTVMLYMRVLSPTGQGVAYHCTFHRPFPLIAWSRAPCAHSGQRLVTSAVSQSAPPAYAVSKSRIPPCKQAQLQQKQPLLPLGVLNQL